MTKKKLKTLCSVKKDFKDASLAQKKNSRHFAKKNIKDASLGRPSANLAPL